MDVGIQAFAEEARELLEQTEDTLLRLEEDATDAETINELFRAVHTIKGAAGLFGFNAVVEFTHVAENVIGSVRSGDLQLGEDLLTLLLGCRDHMSYLVECALESGDGPSPEKDARGVDLLAQLERYDNGDADGPLYVDEVDSTSPAAAECVVPNGASALDGAGDLDSDDFVSNECWHISLRFGRNAFRNGMDPHSFLRYLETVGDIRNLVAVFDELPPLANLDPEDCYLGFEIDLKSDTDKETIEGVFEFVQDDCVLRVLPPYDRISHYVELIEQLPEEPMRLGEILRECGAMTDREIERALHSQSADETTPDAGSGESVPKLGEVAVEQGAVHASVVDAALEKQQTTATKRANEEKFVRVKASKLEDLINLVGELVIAGANSGLLATRTGDGDLIESMESLSRLVEDIRDTTLGLRMVQIGESFNRFRRVVRELSREVGKEVDLEILGGDTELDKTVVEKIVDPLMHLVRNSIDHGLEPPDERLAAGKPSSGKVTLNAYHDSGSIVIEVRDDGRGLNRDKIMDKAVASGLVTPTQSLSDQDVFRLIFEAGFSTAEQVTNISGRGVGMDVVRRNIEALRGLVDVQSAPGEGTRFSIRLPLTLAIIDGFLVRVGVRFYVVPLDLVVECVELDKNEADIEIGRDYINLREEVLPLVRLNDMFGGHDGPAGDRGGRHRENIVVTRFGGAKTGLVVDELHGEYQTVIKPLGTVFENLKVFSGATILGSGELAIILDVPALVQRAGAGSLVGPAVEPHSEEARLH